MGPEPGRIAARPDPKDWADDELPTFSGVHRTQVTVPGRLRVVVAARYDYDTDSFVRIDDAHIAPWGQT